jgi:hypothetical protein
MGTAPGGSTREAVGSGEDGAPGRGETGAGPPGEVVGTGPASWAAGAGPAGGVPMVVRQYRFPEPVTKGCAHGRHTGTSWRSKRGSPSRRS